MAGEEFKVRVGVELDDASFNSLKNQINSVAQKEPIKVKVDTKEAENSVKSLKTQIESLGKTNISLSGATKIESALNDIASSVKEMKASLSSLGNVSGLSNVASAVDKTNAAFNNGAAGAKKYASMLATLGGRSITSDVESTAQAIKNINVAMKQVGFDDGSISAYTKKLDDMFVTVSKIQTKFEDNGALTLTVRGVDELGRAVTTVERMTEVLDESGEHTGQFNFKHISTTIVQEAQKIKNASSEIKSAFDKIDDIDLTFKKAGANVSSLDTKFSKISGQSKEAEVAVEKLKNAYDEFGASIKKNTTQVVEGDDTTREVRNLNEIVLALENYKKAYEEATAAVKKNKAENDKVLSAEKYKNDKTNFINQIERYKSDNSAALLKYGKQLDELIAKTKQLNGVSLNGVKQEFKELQNTIEKDGLATQSFGDKLKTQFKRYAAYFSIASVTMEATQALRQMYQSVLEIDTAMTELYRVTDLTSQGYANLYDNMIASAKQYGATLSDIINSTADWSRAGFDPETANGLAGITMMYEHIADIDYDEATQNLLTAYKGFQGQLDSMFNNDAEASVTYIADILNELDNNYAVTAAGVGEAMRRSAASMDVANNSIEQTAALITGAIEVTQDPEGAGNALKVVSMRLRGAKGELEDLGEEVDSNVENLTQMQGKILNLTHGKVNIFEDNGDFKSTYDILVGIADVYDQLSDMERADLLETIAGKHRANTVASIIGNIDQVKAAYQSATEASGSASEENEKYMNSLEGHLNKLTTAWQSFSNSFLSSGFLKGLISTASGFLNVIDSIVDKMGTIPTIISLIAAGLSGIKNIGFFKTVKDETTGFVTKMELSFAGLKGKIGELKDLLNNSVKFDFDKDFTDSLGLNEKTLNQYIAGGQKSEYLEDATDAVIDYVKATDKASISVEDFRGKQMAAAAQINGSARTFKGASNVISVFNSMTKETEKTQQGFVNAIANSNPKLASYLSSVKAGSASFKGYVGSLVGATVRTVALTAATIALNAALTMGISVLVSAAISAIDSWIHKNEKLAESVQDVIDKYNEQKNSLKDAKAVVDEVVTSDGSKSRYEELSKGVDSLGKNVSLTADEYSEYLDITSRIASSFPELIQGYDSQGNAILSCKGNVEELIEAYNKLGHAANKEILNKNSIDDIQEDFKNDIEDLNDSGFWDNELTTDATKALEKMINSSDVDSAVQKNVSGYYTQIATALHDAKIGDYESIDPYWSFSWQIKDYIADCIETDRAGVQKIVDAHNSELDDAAAEMKQAAEAALSEAFDFSDSDYYGMSDSLKTIAQQAVNNLDGEFYQKVVNSGGDIRDYINSMVKALDGIDNNGNSVIETSFDLQTKFNNGEVSYGEYADALANAQNTIDGLKGVDSEIKKQLKLALDTKDAENQYKTFVNRLIEAGWSDDAAKKFARSLSSSEMEVAFDLVAKGELKVENADELRKQLEEQAKLNEAMSFSIDMETETEGVEAFTTALTESNSATGLTVESMEKLKARYKDLDGYNPATLFQETANGLMLNASAARELEKAYAESKLGEANDNLTTLKQRYDELGVEIQKCDDASKKASLINEREDIRQQITQIAEYATALDGLTSAYTDWQTAESAGSNRDMYSNVQSAMESVKEELDLGWIDDGTKEYFDLIWGDNWNGAGKGISDYRAQWDTLDDTIEGTTYSLQDFFKTDEDGNLTSKGIYNFLDAVKQKQKELGKDWVQTDKNGNIVSFDFGVDGTKAVADALGISEDLVNIFLKASQDCGFVVNFDGTYKQLADLQNEAMAANDKLKELGKTDYTFNFDSKNIKDLNNQLEVAKDILADKSFWNKDGTFNFNAKGATEAMQVVSTLQATIDSLDNKYIGLTVDDSSLKEPLEKLQEYESTTAEINQLELDPKANTEEIEAAKEKLHDIVDYFYELDNTEKKKLGIDVDASWEEIQEMVEKGEIEIPAALDIQTSINDNLEDLVKLSLLNSGVLNEDEKVEIEQELKVKYNISDDSETKEDVEEAIHDKFDNYSATEDLDADINVNIEGEQNVRSLINYLGSLSDEQIQVVANVIGKVDVEKLQTVINGLDNKTVQAIAQALGEGDVKGLQAVINGLDNKTVQAIAEAFGYGDVTSLKNAIKNMDGKTVKAIAQALGISDVNSLKSVVNSLDDKTVQAIAEAIGQGKVQSLIDTIANLKDKTVTTSVVTKYVKQGIENGAALGKWAVGKRTGVGSVNGTANVNGAAFVNGTVGKAFKQGNWGTKDSGCALVGELGQELLVRDGQYYTIGDNGAEFIDYKKGDIIFNAGQTRQLFEQGKIVNGQTRGRAYASGTAFNLGNAVSSIPYSEGRLIDLFELSDQLNVDVGVNLDTSSIEAQLIEYEKGGNVKLLVRPSIDTQYLKDVGWDDAGDGVATVFTSTYSNEDGTVAVNFTPIMVDENGKFVGVLGPDELQEYAEGVIAGTRTDDLKLQIGAEFTGEDAIEKADLAAQRIHELHEIYFADDPVIQYVSDNNEKSANTSTASTNSIANNSASGAIDGGIVAYEIQFNMSDETDWLNELSEIMESNATETGLTADQVDKLTKKYGKLKSFNASKLFQHTASGIKVNNQELSKLNKEYQETNYQKIRNDYSGLVSSYNSLTDAIGKASNAADRASLITQRNELSKQIDLIHQLGIEYSTTCSQYNRWVDSTSSAEGYDAYGNIATYKKQVEDEISRGFLGNASKEYIQLLSGKDLTGGTIDDYYDEYLKSKEAVTGLGYSVQDMFTVNDDGNVTAYGVHAFMDSVKNDFADMYDEATNTWDFSQENIQRIVDGYNMSADAIGMILQAANPAGYNVQWKDIFGDMDFSTTPFEDMVKYAQLAEEELSQLFGKDYQFNFASSTLDDAVQEIDNAKAAFSELTDENGVKFLNEDGTINFQANGASDVAAIMRALTIQKQQLETPVVMQVDVSKLNGTSQELQDYVVRTQELNDAMQQYEIAVNSGDEEDIAAKTEQLQTAAQNYSDAATNLQQSNPDVAAKLKAGSGKDVASELQEELSGETVDVQAVLKLTTEGNSVFKGIDNSDIADAAGKSVSEITNENYANIRAEMIVEDLNPNGFFEKNGNGYKINIDALVAAKGPVNLDDVTTEDGKLSIAAIAHFYGVNEDDILEDIGNGQKGISLDVLCKLLDIQETDFLTKTDNGWEWDVGLIAKTLNIDPSQITIGENGRPVIAADVEVGKIDTSNAEVVGSDDTKSGSQSDEDKPKYYGSDDTQKSSSEKLNEDVGKSDLAEIYNDSSMRKQIIEGMSDDELEVVVNAAFSNTALSSELGDNFNAELWRAKLLNDEGLQSTLLTNLGFDPVDGAFFGDFSTIYEKFTPELKAVADSILAKYGITINKDTEKANETSVTEAGYASDDSAKHLSNVFDILGNISNADFSSFVNDNGIKEGLSNLNNWSEYLTELSNSNPAQAAKILHGMGYENATEENAKEYAPIISQADVDTWLNKSGIAKAFESPEEFKKNWSEMDDAAKSEFSSMIDAIIPGLSKILDIVADENDKSSIKKNENFLSDMAKEESKDTFDSNKYVPNAMNFLSRLLSVFGIETANASEADEGSSAKDSSNNSGKSGGRSANGSKPVQYNDSTEVGSVVSVDTSNAPEAEVPVKGELEDTDTSNAPEEQVDVEGKMNKVDDSVLNDPFQVAVDDSGIKDALQDGETLKSMLLGLDDDTLMAFGNIAPGFQNALGSAQELRDVIANVPADGLQLSFSSVYDGLGDALTSAEALNEYLNSITDEGQRQVIIDLIMSKDSEEQTVNAEIQADDSDIVAKTSEQRDVPAVIDLNTFGMDSYLGTTKHSTVALDPYLIKKSFTGTIALTTTSVSGTGNVKVNGTANANGTAYVNGTVGKAFRHGNWGTGDSGTALVGELGQEMVVRDGQFFTIGDNGAEFFQYKKNDIIFNAGQTKQLFEQGKITNGRTRGRAFNNGYSATVSGSKFEETSKNNVGYVSGKKYGSTSSSSSGSNSGDSDASDEADEFEETLDWIETKINRIERAISKLDTTASSVYKNWGTRNEALVNQISKVGEEINLQQQAYDRYMQQANSVGLSEDYASKVRDGTIDIETITDEDLNDKISDYKEW